MNPVALLIVAAAIEHLEDFASFEAADRSYDAGEWSDALRETPRSVDAAVAVVDLYERATLTGPRGQGTATWAEWDAYCAGSPS